jgi:hypothetical protein
MTRSLARIRGGIGRERAEMLIASVAGGWTPRTEACLFYPYFWFLFRCSTRTLFGETGLKVSCLIDAQTSVGATADAFELEHVGVPAGDVIEPRLDEAEANRLAERYVAYVVRNKRKALVVPKLEVLEHALVFKPFWIVTCTNSSKPDFRVMVDGITGGFQVLSPPNPSAASPIERGDRDPAAQSADSRRPR